MLGHGFIAHTSPVDHIRDRSWAEEALCDTHMHTGIKR